MIYQVVIAIKSEKHLFTEQFHGELLWFDSWAFQYFDFRVRLAFPAQPLLLPRTMWILLWNPRPRKKYHLWHIYFHFYLSLSCNSSKSYPDLWLLLTSESLVNYSCAFWDTAEDRLLWRRFQQNLPMTVWSMWISDQFEMWISLYCIQSWHSSALLHSVSSQRASGSGNPGPPCGAENMESSRWSLWW